MFFIIWIFIFHVSFKFHQHAVIRSGDIRIMIFLDKMNSLVPFIMYENSLEEHIIY